MSDEIALLPSSARVVAIIVAIETYRPGTQQIESVVFAEADARAFQKVIEKAFAQNRPEILLLINNNATFSDVVNAVAERAYGLGPDDLFILYYAGHGFCDEGGNRLTVWDTNLINVRDTTLSIDNHVLFPLRKSECKRVLAFVDACASRFKPLGRTAIAALNSKEFAKILQATAFNAVFLSCRAGEQSYPDHDLGHGIWTRFLLRALDGLAEEAVNQRGFITNATLQDYLRQKVARHVANRPRIKATQTPEVIITTTNTFPILYLGKKTSQTKKSQPLQMREAGAQDAAVNPPEHDRYAGSSTEFFARRFGRSFPGLREVGWFVDPTSIKMRLLRLLEAPLAFGNANPIWWWRDGNLQIESFSIQPNALYLMDIKELDIRRIAAVPGRAYWQSFVYVETAALPPSGAYDADPEGSQRRREKFGYDYEEYGVVDGHHAITRGEYDDGAAIINDELQDIHNRAELRVRHLSPYNFIIAPKSSPINNFDFDEILEDRLNSILRTGNGLEGLAKEISRLRRPSHLHDD